MYPIANHTTCRHAPGPAASTPQRHPGPGTGAARCWPVLRVCVCTTEFKPAADLHPSIRENWRTGSRHPAIGPAASLHMYIYICRDIPSKSTPMVPRNVWRLRVTYCTHANRSTP
jgi:hypothetical protein